MDHEGRKDPETLIGQVPESKKGRLKVYLGFAAGVGRPPHAGGGHALQKDVDVVIGFVETHLRPETEALVAGWRRSRCAASIRGVSSPRWTSMRCWLASRRWYWWTRSPTPTRRVAGTGAATKTSKILSAGINVICAFNIQHLESLNDLVQRSTGVVVRETVPDTFLQDADQVVTLESRSRNFERLARGNSTPEKVTQALQNFFKPSNLAALRELALREVARDQSWKREERELL